MDKDNLESDYNTDVIRSRRILVIDDHRNIRISLRMTLEGEGAHIFEAEDCTSATKMLGKYDKDGAGFQYDCVLLDIRMPDGSGLDILKTLSENNLASKIIMISGEGTVTDAFKATQMGAFDYIEKPFGEERIIVSVARCLNFNRVQGDKEKLEKKVFKEGDILGEHPSIVDVMKMVKRVAPTNGRVLIHGESGTGKELLARAVHRNSSRSDKSMIKVNCAAIPINLIESELFGHEKGSFTGATKTRHGVFERADGGTLFLDEIGELGLDVQAKLLRALQNGEVQRVGSEKTQTVDVRLVAATNRDLQEMVESGEFREDLFYRLNVVSLTLPPLRDRKSDIGPLVQHFIEDACVEHQLGKRSFTKAAMEQMENHPWPGNIRELKNLVERVAILSESEVIDHIDDLEPAKPRPLSTSSSSPKDPPATESQGSATPSGKDFQFLTELKSWQEFHESAGRLYIKHVLRLSGGNVSEAARMLCLERAYLHRLMKKLGVQRDVIVP